MHDMHQLHPEQHSGDKVCTCNHACSHAPRDNNRRCAHRMSSPGVHPTDLCFPGLQLVLTLDLLTRAPCTQAASVLPNNTPPKPPAINHSCSSSSPAQAGSNSRSIFPSSTVGTSAMSTLSNVAISSGISPVKDQGPLASSAASTSSAVSRPQLTTSVELFPARTAAAKILAGGHGARVSCSSSSGVEETGVCWGT